MTDKEFKRLSRAQLLDIIYQLQLQNEELIYQIDLCVPALTAFAIAASIALRRKGFAKTGFCIQFAGPVLFFLLAFAETFA